MSGTVGRVVSVYAGLTLASIVLLGSSLLVGRSSVFDETMGSAVFDLRAARTLVAYFAGASLAVAGVLVQGLFRNPLASPSIIGASAGANLGGQLTLMLSNLLLVGLVPSWLASDMLLPWGCVLGAAIALSLLQALVRRSRDPMVLLLVGFLLNSLFLSISSLITSIAQESWELGRAIIAFALGDIAGSGSRHVWMIAPLCLLGTVASWLWAKPLDLLLSGEEEASTLGLDVNLVRRWCIAWTAILTAGAVAVGGGVSFVGLIVPHALRPLVGVAHARLIPAAALGGGGFVVACDMLARSLPARGEIPLGVVTGLIGAPVFLLLLLKHQRDALRE
ncbi:MAG: hypothetical protein RJA70_4484 [Pseudomonadota bacterium]|jgi:iron complex transport system permease protein